MLDAEAEVVAEAVNGGFPHLRINVVRSRNDDALAGMDSDHFGLDHEVVTHTFGGPANLGFELKGTFPDARGSDHIGCPASQSSSPEFVLFMHIA
jgi:hypothetical protein